MKKVILLSVLLMITIPLTAALSQEPAAAEVPAAATSSAAPAMTAEDLSQYIYSYGTVISATATELKLQEYDYDSDVEKEVTYQLDPALKLEGIKSTSELMAEDVVEVYYLEQDGKKVAKIIRKETLEEESFADISAAEEGGN